MRFLRLRLTNYRGIKNSEIEIARDGLTIIEGPNEAGKSSHVEAIRLLFEYKDNSKNAEVKAIKPVDNDVGSEIELEAETGPYAFTYCKRFNKANHTSLRITEPRLENLTGFDAHQRALEILEETMDVQLWKALCIQQGEPIQQADLSNQESLSKILDLVAAGQGSNYEEQDLLEKVKLEHDLYFTEKGTLKQKILEEEKALNTVREEIKSLTSQINDLEKFSDCIAQAREELQSLQKQEKDLEEDVNNYQKSIKEITDLETKLEFAQLTFDKAEEKQKRIKTDLNNRSDLLEKIQKKNQDVIKENNNIETIKLHLGEIEKSYKDAQFEREATRKEFTEAQWLFNVSKDDLTYMNKNERLAILKHEKIELDRVRKEKAKLASFICACKVDENTLNEINKAEKELVEARARLDIGAPSLTLRGLNDQELIINGQDLPISKNEEQYFPILEKISVSIPGSLNIEITPGISALDLQQDALKAQEKLDDLCRKVNVTNPEEAQNTHAKLLQAKNEHSRYEDNEKKNLLGRSHNELETEYQALMSACEFYHDNRQTELPIPETIETAEKEHNEAAKKYEILFDSFNDSELKLKDEKNRFENVTESYNKAKQEHNYLIKEINETQQRLDGFRAEVTDENLQTDLNKAIDELKSSKLALENITNELRSKQPDVMRFRLDIAEESLKLIRDKIQTVLDEKRNAESYIKVHGEKGLRELLDAAKTKEKQQDSEYKSKVRRADAIKLLYSYLNEERDISRRSYIKPLKDKVELLGRIVFNDTFEVEISENLMVEGRIMNNRNVPFASLSGGAKEQLSMLSRLACAMMTSKQGTGSLFIDDALGYTDAKRLKSMGFALARASKECQIVVLTCMPDRYDNVGSAKKIKLNNN